MAQGSRRAARMARGRRQVASARAGRRRFASMPSAPRASRLQPRPAVSAAYARRDRTRDRRRHRADHEDDCRARDYRQDCSPVLDSVIGIAVLVVVVSRLAMAPSGKIPRVVIAATGSGAGKTTVTVALIAALRARGLKVAAFKCGPDYLDPTYHRRAAGIVSHNLDGWMMGRDAVLGTFTRVAGDFDISIIEGMMGLYDSATPTGDEGSTAEIAKWLRAPVLLVVDASGMARSIAATANGYAHFEREVNVAGIICNRIGGRGHLDILRMASSEIPVVGGLPGNAELAFPERHLGLRTADENAVPARLFEAWGNLATEWLDLDAIISVARAAPELEFDNLPTRRVAGSRCKIGIAWDDAFHFYY